MLDMENGHLNILKKILAKYPYHFYAFGSRATGNAKKYSDLDLCFKEKIPGHVIIEIKEELEESNLPFTVDLVDWNNCSEEFQRRISKNLKAL